MYIQLTRLQDNGHSTIGVMHVNGAFECFTLEDTHNEPKIYGQSRIPSGKYEIKLRKDSPMSKRYEAKRPVHEGMLWLQNVPGYEYVYIHIGNTEDDTDGCILLGQTCSSREEAQTVGGSVLAYDAFYPKALEALRAGEDVTIEVI